MIQIKFSHEYYKMPFGMCSGCRTETDPTMKTWLVGICRVRLEDLPKQFLDFDTLITMTNEHYPLPEKGQFLLLILYTVEDGETIGQTWQTIRSFSIEKEQYYEANVGKEVEIVIA